MDFLALVNQKIMTVEQFQTVDRQDKQMVFTNGCFDILHAGHVTCLAKARQLGDMLVVGLNSDASVRRLKGTSRPLNPEAARAQLLASLLFVDAVILFEEDTPLQLIEAIQPDILTKGSDYAIENIVGAKEVLARGGQVCTVELVKGYSTSNYLNLSGSIKLEH
ncbi:MAG: D-glycero-beta-D-manno-heptose 1-phosphate adenylyltransferase [Bacteroidales bacterium]|jgi:rfaE bifunctional protein nucleotidyltransferase chain/domain|nr:D-glycero-beta-D-manno-heptose 1-phosphate adenylyltransferase [Bacteroidales bacterium]